jgi:L-asparaginase II
VHETISVLVTRAGEVESRHRVHAVAMTADGKRVLEAGNGDLVTFMRSSAKPLQALPLARAYPGLGSAELAIACASHLADADQLRAVANLLDHAGVTEDQLECGEDGDPPARIRHNCSGKHASMLALCRARGWLTSGYRLADHPAQRAMLAEIAAATELQEREIPTAVDGCGVVTFALPLARMALAFARLESLDAGDRVAAAMRAHPALIRGEGAPDTVLMQTRAGWIAKGGAEALLCAASPERLGLAVKVEDGGSRAVGPAVAAALRCLGIEVHELASSPIRNSRGDRVGEIAAQCAEMGKNPLAMRDAGC